jgi:type IV secretion system protein VirD4
MLDEFPALGRIPVIADSTAFLPGYNVRTVVIVQSNSQLIEKYGIEGAKSIRKMLAARIVFPPKEYEDAEAISRELGTYTVRQKNVSRPMWGGANKEPTVSISEQPRRLLLPQEVKELGPDRMILFYEGLRPVLAHRILYFRDRLFASRELPPPPVPKLNVDKSGGVAAPTPAATPDDRKDTPGPGPGSISNATPQDGGAALTARQAGTVAGDVLNDDLTLDDFSFDFEDVEIPTEKLSDEDMRRHADAFMARVLD